MWIVTMAFSKCQHKLNPTPSRCLANEPKTILMVSVVHDFRESSWNHQMNATTCGRSFIFSSFVWAKKKRRNKTPASMLQQPVQQPHHCKNNNEYSNRMKNICNLQRASCLRAKSSSFIMHYSHTKCVLRHLVQFKIVREKNESGWV